MGLLKLHFEISVLCLLMFIGFREVWGEQIKENGWVKDDNKKNKGILKWLAFFVPFMNLLLVIAILIMVVIKKEDAEKILEN